MTRQKSITKKRLQRLLDAYGAQVSRWPVAEKAAAERYLAEKTAQDDIANSLCDTRAFDSWLQDEMTQPAPSSDAFLNRLIALSQQPQARRPSRQSDGRFKGLDVIIRAMSPTAYPARAAILGIAFAAGLWIGAMSSTGTDDGTMDLSPWLMGYDLAFYEETVE